MQRILIVRNSSALNMPGLDAEKAAWVKEVESRLTQIERALKELHPEEITILDNLEGGLYAVSE